MTLPADPPKLPKWPFLVGDVALLGLAWFIANRSPTPFAGSSLIAVVACVVIGAVIATYPFVIEYTRAQEIALDDRQKSLETLSRTVATSAEQISIAANGLHEITELAQRNLKVAEQLPLKIQEKIAAVIAGFEDTRADEREELEREVATLRAAESEQLSVAADKIARTVADLTKLEATTQKHLSDSVHAITRASDTLAPIDAKIIATIERAERALSASVQSAGENRRGYAVNFAAESPLAEEPTPSPASAEFSHPVSEMPSAVSREEPKVYPTTLPPQVNELPNTTEGLMVADPFTAAIMSVLDSKPPGFPSENPNSADSATRNSEVLAPPEPAPIHAETIPEIVPVAPRDGASMSPILLPADSTLMKPARKRAPRKPKSAPLTEPSSDTAPSAPAPSAAPAAEPEFSEPTPALADAEPTPALEPVSVAATAIAESPVAVSIDSPEEKSSNVSTPEPTENALSSDGATRLLVTAYIGIGNRLFIRGEGPGLSWDKGVPLQFVSIGKWRWENHDSTGTVPYKLYKNDTVECTALGLLSLEAGHQHEVTAKF